jgi:hypothetical protein
MYSVGGICYKQIVMLAASKTCSFWAALINRWSALAIVACARSGQCNQILLLLMILSLNYADGGFSNFKIPRP